MNHPTVVAFARTGLEPTGDQLRAAALLFGVSRDEAERAGRLRDDAQRRGEGEGERRPT